MDQQHMEPKEEKRAHWGQALHHEASPGEGTLSYIG